MSVRCQEAGGRKRARDCLDEKRRRAWRKEYDAMNRMRQKKKKGGGKGGGKRGTKRDEIELSMMQEKYVTKQYALG